MAALLREEGKQQPRHSSNLMHDFSKQWLARKYRVRGSGWSRFSDHHLYTVLGLLRL